MFNNVGHKIKGVISTVTAILMVVSVIEGIAVFFILKWELEFWAFLIGLAVAGIGILFSWLANLVGYAFGQLVENSDRIREMMENSNAYNNGNQLTSFDIKATQTKAFSSYKPTINTGAIQENTTYVTCPGCKESHPAGKTYCNICGAKLNSNIPSHTQTTPLEKIGKATQISGETNEFVSCSKCGELQPKGKNYCQICGGKII